MNKCDYCVDGTFGNDNIESENSDIKLVPIKTKLGTKLVMYLDYNAYSMDSSFEETIDIKYCPMCGRELKEAQE